KRVQTGKPVFFIACSPWFDRREHTTAEKWGRHVGDKLPPPGEVGRLFPGEEIMGFLRSANAGAAALLLVVASLGPARGAAAQGAIAVPLGLKSVQGKLDTLDKQRGGIFVVSDDGRKMSWRLEKGVIDRLTGFKKGDPIVVIYRQRGGGNTAVTAVAFPGAAATPVYI